jgi:excisionase family DNA binding protein
MLKEESRSLSRKSLKKETGMEPLGLSVKEASVLLGLSTRVTYYLVNSGKLNSVRVGTRYLITRKAIEQFLDGQ